MDLALNLSNQGKDLKALYAIQVEVQKNPKNHKAWVTIGKLYQDCDMDDEAIICF